jgi:hypothetical protein
MLLRDHTAGKVQSCPSDMGMYIDSPRKHDAAGNIEYGGLSGEFSYNPSIVANANIANLPIATVRRIKYLTAPYT